MNPRYSQTILDTFNESRKTNTLTDLTLVAQSQRFPVHKTLLVMASEYFARALLGGFREGGQKELVLQETPEVLGLVLDAIYGQWKPSGNFRLDLLIAKKLIYYQVKGFDPDYLVLNTKVNPQDFAEYLRDVAGLYEEGISEEVANHLSSMIEPGADLSEFSDETITSLLLSPNYNPKSVQEIYNLISGLISKGHSMELASLINYDLFPDVFKNSLPQEFLKRYNKKGPLPRLGDITSELARSTRSQVKLVINASPTPDKDGVPMISAIDATGDKHDLEWYSVSSGISVGDILTLQVWYEWPRYAAALLSTDISSAVANRRTVVGRPGVAAYLGHSAFGRGFVL